jgi:hypothetical protein
LAFPEMRSHHKPLRKLTSSISRLLPYMLSSGRSLPLFGKG